LIATNLAVFLLLSNIAGCIGQCHHASYSFGGFASNLTGARMIADNHDEIDQSMRAETGLGLSLAPLDGHRPEALDHLSAGARYRLASP
jgi:hypothetical protein